VPFLHEALALSLALGSTEIVYVLGKSITLLAKSYVFSSEIDIED